MGSVGPRGTQKEISIYLYKYICIIYYKRSFHPMNGWDLSCESFTSIIGSKLYSTLQNISKIHGNGWTYKFFVLQRSQ